MAAITLLAGGAASAYSASDPASPFGTSQVGTQPGSSRILLPDDQWVQPDGQRITLTAESVGAGLSPDGTHLAVQSGGRTTGAQNVNIVDAASGSIVQTFGGTGIAAPVYSPDGSSLYTAQYGTITRYAVGPDGTVTNPNAPVVIKMPTGAFEPYGGQVDGGSAPGGSALPTDLAFSGDGSTLYAVEDGSNSLAVIDTATDTVTAQLPAGNVPVNVVVAGGKAYVSDRGGDSPGADQFSNNTGGTHIAANPYTGGSVSGTVSVIDLATGTLTDTIKVGLQPAAMALHDGALFVANTNSDTVSVIDTATDKVTQTFNVEPLPGSSVGASPNAFAFAGGELLVSIGGDNAVAEFRYTGLTTPVAYQGLIPTDWYPNGIVYDQAASKVFVSNENGIGTDNATITHKLKGSVTSFALPDNATLGTLTSQVFDNNGWNDISNAKPRPNVKPVPIPARLGESSTIKHVFLIVRENNTYDYILGDDSKGNGDPAYATFGENYGIVPNATKISNQFTLFDNFYDPGTLSADGHNWLFQADANDYLEQDSATNWGRSYPANGGDALAYQRDGFLWDAAERAGDTVKDFGEHEEFWSGTPGTWQQYYADSQIMEHKATGTMPISENAVQYRSDNPSLTDVNDPVYPTFNQNIPDQYRVDVWEQNFEQSERTGHLANLNIIYLPDDHTGGTPSPQSSIADNDLATGRVFDDISHSPFWKDSAVFVMEDDTQDGNDHVDGHRGPLLVESPYLKRDAVNNTYYTQINVVKTIEDILGIQPMNQMDRAAEPMYDAFTDTPDYTPYNVAANQYPLTQNVTGLIPLTPITGAPQSSTPPPGSPAATTAASTAAEVPAAEKAVAAAWATWYKTEAEPKVTGPHAVPDSTNPPQLNRYNWYTATGWTRPYPGDKKILAPDQVPGRNLPSAFLGDG